MAELGIDWRGEIKYGIHSEGQETDPVSFLRLDNLEPLENDHLSRWTRRLWSDGDHYR